MNILFAHAGHEHAAGTNPVTHHLPALIALTVVIATIGGLIFWLLTRQQQEDVTEHIDKS